jgi:hypothetical protein
MFSKQRESLPLLCEVILMVLTFGQKDKFAYMILPLLYFALCVFTPIAISMV